MGFSGDFFGDVAGVEYGDLGIFGKGIDLMSGGGQTGVGSALSDPHLGNSTNANFAQMLAQTQNRGGVNYDTSQQDQFRGQQQAFAQALQAQMAGNGPSLAQSQLQQATDQNLQNQAAIAASSRGVSAGMAQRQAMQGFAGTQQQSANQSAMLRAQDQLNAQGMYGNLINQGRTQDIGVAGQQAQIGLENQGQRDSFSQNLLALGNQRDLGFLSAQQRGAEDVANIEEAYKNRRAGGIKNMEQTASSMGQSASSMGGSGGGAAMMASDERLKTEITDGAKEIQALLDAITPKSFRYLDKRWGEGEFVGIMAQDLEKSAIGKELVADTKDGKLVNLARAYSAILASLAHLNARINNLELSDA